MVKKLRMIEEDGHIIIVSFTITNIKLYVPVVSFSINDNIKFLKKCKARI